MFSSETSFDDVIFTPDSRTCLSRDIQLLLMLCSSFYSVHSSQLFIRRNNNNIYIFLQHNRHVSTTTRRYRKRVIGDKYLYILYTYTITIILLPRVVVYLQTVFSRFLKTFQTIRMNEQTNKKYRENKSFSFHSTRVSTRTPNPLKKKIDSFPVNTISDVASGVLRNPTHSPFDLYYNDNNKKKYANVF